MKTNTPQPSYRNASARRWVARLWGRGLRESWRPVAPAPFRPKPALWQNDEVTVAWLGHATVLINFFGVTVLTDPVLFSQVGVRVPVLGTIGPKRQIAPALAVEQLPAIDLILLSHAHFDHLDLRTLKRFDKRTRAVTAARTADLLRGTQLREITELPWGESRTLETAVGTLKITALPVRHWGARLHFDSYRGYNGYLLERKDRRIIFSGDTAMTEDFASGGQDGPADLAIMSIGCYNPWIETHATPEEAVRMAMAAGARFVMPVHHQTFRLSFEPMREPLERFERAALESEGRIALREIGETFVLPE